MTDPYTHCSLLTDHWPLISDHWSLVTDPYCMPCLYMQSIRGPEPPQKPVLCQNWRPAPPPVMTMGGPRTPAPKKHAPPLSHWPTHTHGSLVHWSLATEITVACGHRSRGLCGEKNTFTWTHFRSRFSIVFYHTELLCARRVPPRSWLRQTTWKGRSEKFFTVTKKWCVCFFLLNLGPWPMISNRKRSLVHWSLVSLLLWF